MCSTWGALRGRARCLPSGHMQTWNIAKKTPCSQRIASGALDKRPSTKVRLASVGLEYNEVLRAIWGPLAGEAWTGAPAKWARDMTPNMAYNPTLAFYTQPSGLESKCAYILE